MTAVQWLGVALLASPFVLIAAGTIHFIGWKATALIYTSAAVFVTIVIVGSLLASGELG